MIKPSELRLNNIVLFNNQVSVIKGITTNHIHVEGVLRETGNPIIPNEYREIEAADPTITPLPLSHRLLSRVLFLSPSNVEGRGYYLSNKGNYMVLSEGDSFYVGMFVPDLVHIIPGPIDSFHQLQNAFYTIYNREISVDVDSLRMKWRSWNGKGA